MNYYIGFTVIMAILTGGGTPFERPCHNNSLTDPCKLITISKFRCVYETKFIESSTFNITSYQNKLYTCDILSVNRGTVTFECPFNVNFTLLKIKLTITALGRKQTVNNGADTKVIFTNLTELFRPSKASNVMLNASEDVGIRISGYINKTPFLPTTKTSVHATFSSIHNFHEPMQVCWTFRSPQINHTLDGFHPYEDYVVKIYWKIENGDYCSPVTVASIRTKPSIPTAAPEILKGSYSDTLHNNKSALYWKTISKYHENGPSVKYIIYKLPTHIMKDNYKLLHNFTSLIQLDNVSHYFNVSNLEPFQIETVGEFHNSIMFSHDVLPGDHLLIRTKNEVGSSDAYSSIEFTSKGKHMVQHFIASQLNQTHFELSWSSTMTFTTTFDVILYWCYGIYWTLPGWTECKNNISEMTISSSELERTETSFKTIQILPSDIVPLTIDNPSSLVQKSVALKLVASDEKLPPSYLQLGVSIQYDQEFSPIVWNSTIRLNGPPSQKKYLAVYIVIGVTGVMFLLLIVCVCRRLNSKKRFLKRYEITRPANFDQSFSENGVESASLPSNTSAQYVDRERHDSGVGTLSIPSSSPSSTQIVIPMSSTDTSVTASSGGSFPSSPQIVIPVSTTETSFTPSTGGSSPDTTLPVITDTLRNALTAKYSPPAKLVQDSHTANASPAFMLKPKPGYKVVADKSQLVDYSIATIQDIQDKESESEGSSSSTSLPLFKTNSRPTSVKNKLQKHQQQIAPIHNSDSSDNDSDVANYPPTSIVYRPDSEEIMC